MKSRFLPIALLTIAWLVFGSAAVMAQSIKLHTTQQEPAVYYYEGNECNWTGTWSIEGAMINVYGFTQCESSGGQEYYIWMNANTPINENKNVSDWGPYTFFMRQYLGDGYGDSKHQKQ